MDETFDWQYPLVLGYLSFLVPLRETKEQQQYAVYINLIRFHLIYLLFM